MTAPTQTQQRAPAGRLAYVDNLRVAMTVLVVAHHVALAYGNLGMWPNWEQPRSAVAGLPLDVFVLINQSYFMGFFFLISGLFVPRSVDRRGAGGFLRERVRRLGIPLVAALIIIRPLYALPQYLDQPAGGREPYWTFFLTNWNIGPLWFLEVLLLFSLGYAVFRRARPGATEMSVRPVRVWQLLAFIAALGLVTYAWRIMIPVGTSLLAIPSASHLPQYAALFVVGLLAFRRGWLTALPARTGLLGGSLLLFSMLPMILLGGYETLQNGAAVPPAGLPHLGFALWEAAFGIGAILVLIAVFRRRVTGDGRLAQFLARNAFAVYLVHAPVVVGVVALMHPVTTDPLVKFAIGLPISLVASWGLSALIRKLPGVRSVL